MEHNNTGFVVALATLALIAILVFALWGRKRRTERRNLFLAEQGVVLDFNFYNRLGICQDKKKVFIDVGRPLLLDAARVRSVETSSIMETKVNGWGMQVHKDKHCKMTIHTDDLETPSYTIHFGHIKQMELWRSRLRVFCNLS